MALGQLAKNLSGWIRSTSFRDTNTKEGFVPTSIAAYSQYWSIPVVITGFVDDDPPRTRLQRVWHLLSNAIEPLKHCLVQMSDAEALGNGGGLAQRKFQSEAPPRAPL